MNDQVDLFGDSSPKPKSNNQGGGFGSNPNSQGGFQGGSGGFNSNFNQGGGGLPFKNTQQEPTKKTHKK